MNEYAFAFICYGLGGIATYVLYQQLDKRENIIQKGLDNFGIDEFED